MTRYNFSILLLIALFQAKSVSAVSGAEEAAECISFQSVAANMLQDNFDLSSAVLDLSMSRANVLKSMSQLYPRLDFNVGMSNIKKYGSIPGLDTLLLGGRDSIDTANADATISWNLYRGGYDKNAIKIEKDKLAMSQLDFDMLRRKLLIDAAKAYNDFVHSKLRLSKSHLELELESHRAKIELEEYAVNLVSLVQLEDTKEKIRMLERKVKYFVDESELYGQILVDLMGPSAARWNQEGCAVSSVNFIDEISQLGVSLNRNFTREKLRKMSSISRKKVSQAKSKFLPTVDLSVQVSFDALSVDDAFDALESIERDTRVVSLNLRWNVFDGLSSTAALREAVAGDQKKKLSLLKENRDNEVSKARYKTSILRVRDEIESLDFEKSNNLRLLESRESEYSLGFVEEYSLIKLRNRIDIIDVEIKMNLHKLNILNLEFLAMGGE